LQTCRIDHHFDDRRWWRALLRPDIIVDMDARFLAFNPEVALSSFYPRAEAADQIWNTED